MFSAILPNTGQSQATLLSIFIIGGVLVIAGIAAMVAVRASRKKNADATTFKPEAAASTEPAATKPVAKKPAAKKPAATKPAAKKPAAKKAAKPAADDN